jgi:hypothetical protein
MSPEAYLYYPLKKLVDLKGESADSLEHDDVEEEESVPQVETGTLHLMPPKDLPILIP